jgi:ATPase subunit of ABC transporter with duplicated ATPase domains
MNQRFQQFKTLVYEASETLNFRRITPNRYEALKKASVLSGGEKVRCMLSKLMLSGANVLILNHPTAHLDLESVSALNDGLCNFDDTLLFASQDHEFIQTIANRIICIDETVTFDEPVTFDEYLAKTNTVN